MSLYSPTGKPTSRLLTLATSGVLVVGLCVGTGAAPSSASDEDRSTAERTAAPSWKQPKNGYRGRNQTSDRRPGLVVGPPVNLRGKARKNAEHTYNLTRRLYQLFLDEDRQYTMAYYRDTSNSLEKAQLDKKAHLAAKMYLKPGMKVLDIGCGWGGFALYLHKHYGVEVTGVALAPDQIAFCKERAKALGVDDKVKFHLMDYRDVEGEFDRISSVGLLEHVGTPHYPQFFAHTNRLLKRDGVMISHCCGRAGTPGFTDAWTRKYIFPGGYIPALSELVTESEKNGWQVMDVEAMRFHYSHTLEEWYNRTVMHKDEIVELYDDVFYRMWQFYLAGAEQAFRHGRMVNWQLIYVKDRNAIPMTREFIHEESARLRDSEEPPVWHLAQAAE